MPEYKNYLLNDPKSSDLPSRMGTPRPCLPVICNPENPALFMENGLKFRLFFCKVPLSISFLRKIIPVPFFILCIHPNQKAVIVSDFSESGRVREAQRLDGGAYLKKLYLSTKPGTAIRTRLDK